MSSPRCSAARFDRVYAYVARRVATRSDAQDLTAEVFQQALANLSLRVRAAAAGGRLVGVHTGGEPLRALLERLGLGSASPSVEPSRAPPRASQ